MEAFNKRKSTKKISKIDKDLKHLEKFLPQGIVKETIVAEMKDKKKPLNRRVNQELKKKKLTYTPKKNDQKVNFIIQKIASRNCKRSCMRSL